MKLITSTHYNRPNCTKEMIYYLSNCERVNEYHVIFFIEPGCKEVAKLIEECSLNKTIHYNTSLLGCWVNKKQALDIGFESSDYIIHLEDDVLLSRDALLYFEWAKRFIDLSNDPVATVTAYNRFDQKDYIESYATPSKARKRAWYNSTAWAIHKPIYNLLNNWTGEDRDLMRQLHQEKNMFELYPCLSRANNIGHCNGVNSAVLDVLKVVGNKAYAPIGLSRNGMYFVSDKEAYKNNLLKADINDTILIQLDKCKEFDFENQLITNEVGEEFVKLSEKMYKSRNNKEYKEKYLLDVWAGNLDILETEFEYDGISDTI